MRIVTAVIKLVVSFCLFGLLACSGPEQNDQEKDATGETHDRPVVALIMKSLANEFFVTMGEGAKAHHAQHNETYELIVNGIKNEIDLTQQVALIDQMIASGVDAIVIAPADSKAVVPALARASAAGIVIVNIDNRLDNDILAEYELGVPFVGPDNFLGAKLAGEYLASQLEAGTDVAILEGVSTAYNSQRRTAGFNQAMQDAGLNVVSQQSAEWDQTKAVVITSGILVQYPNLVAILCANDNMALGTAAAVTQAGVGEQIKIIGFDNISAIQTLIKGGRVLATVDQHADLLAVYGIEYALEILNTGSQPNDKSTPIDLITIDSVQ